ncbi:hypothetical protein LguiB_009161 [Lonicera macranthoides]
MLLVRPFPLFDWAKTSIETLTKENYGTVRRVFVVSEKDNMIFEEKQRWMIENNQPNDAKVISGSDHMVMFYLYVIGINVVLGCIPLCYAYLMLAGIATCPLVISLEKE